MHRLRAAHAADRREQEAVGRKACLKVFNQLKASGNLGRYHPSADTEADSKNPLTTGGFSGVKPDRPWRQVAGPALSERALALATVGYEQLRPRNSSSVNKKAMPAVICPAPEDPDGADDDDEPTRVSSGGVRNYITRWRSR
jgi:hypothetical protein